VFLTFFVLCLLSFSRFLWFSDQSCLLLSFFVPILLISFSIISFVLTFLVIYFLSFSHFLGFSDQRCIFYLFCRFFLSLLRFVFRCVFDNFGSLFFAFFYGFLIRVACSYLFVVSILFISFSIISFVLTILVIYFLCFSHFLGFSDQMCFFYLFRRFSSSPLRFVFSRVFDIFYALFVTFMRFFMVF